MSARSFAAKQAARNPLRRVVSTDFDDRGGGIETLECGHEQRVKEDAIGPRYSVRRRCRQCGQSPNAPSQPNAADASITLGPVSIADPDR